MYKAPVPYKDDATLFEGFFAVEKETPSTPAVLICHAWSGHDQFVRDIALKMAGWGYAAFALDVYGKGVVGRTKEEKAALMTPLMADRGLLQKRLLAGLKALKAQPHVDTKRIAVMGFCFGGLCALDLARSGADLKGAISIHGLFLAPQNVERRPIKAHILALHGHDDPLVPPDQVAAFEAEMTTAKADWQLHIYGGTKHAFTDPRSNDPVFGTVYNPIAAQRAWQSIHNFLAETLS